MKIKRGRGREHSVLFLNMKLLTPIILEEKGYLCVNELLDQMGLKKEKNNINMCYRVLAMLIKEKVVVESKFASKERKPTRYFRMA